MEFGWQILLGTLIGFFGAAFGSVGGVGGGGIFVPMLSLIIGFDPKSSTAISKCEDLLSSSCWHALKSESYTFLLSLQNDFLSLFSMSALVRDESVPCSAFFLWYLVCPLVVQFKPLQLTFWKIRTLNLMP